LDHVVLQVPDLEKSAGFYRRFFGKETSRERTTERIWFTAARTRLGLEKMAESEKPRVDRFGIRVAAFDRQAITRKLDAIGVMVLPSTGGNILRFRDADGFAVELRGV
jgi:catechol 2,3-dioxygenase-like lactoylglutathione lyase family enzyme